MNAERALVSRIAHSRTGLEELISSGVQADQFLHDDCREVWEFIRTHGQKYGKQPTVPTILEHCPHFNFEIAEEPIEYIMEMYFENLERREATEYVREMAHATSDPEYAGKLVELAEGKLRKIRERLPVAKDGDEAARSGWEAVYIHEAQAPKPPDIAGLFYTGGLHLVSGEPSSMKTWLTLVAAAEVIRAGGAVMFISFPGESGKGEVVERLRQLGLSEREIIRCIFLEPKTPLSSPGALEAVRTLVEGWSEILRLVVLDSAGSALELHGLDEMRGSDIQRFGREVIAPFRTDRVAVVVIDHVVKSSEGRGKWAYGSQRKVGATDVHLGLEMRREFGRGREGIATIKTKRDRIGQLPASGELRLTSDPETDAVDYKLTLTDAEADWAPTEIMRKVSRYLAGISPETKTQTEIEEQKLGKRAADVRLALDLLVRGEYVRREKRPGRGGGYIYSSTRLYLGDEDEPEGSSNED